MTPDITFFIIWVVVGGIAFIIFEILLLREKNKTVNNFVDFLGINFIIFIGASTIGLAAGFIISSILQYKELAMKILIIGVSLLTIKFLLWKIYDNNRRKT